MTFKDISTIRASIVVNIGGEVIPIDNFDPDSDIFTVNDRQTADGEKTIDGYFNYWAVNSVIEASFNVSGGSEAGKTLRGILNAQVNGQVSSATVVVTNGDVVNTYGPGILTTGKPGPHLGNQKLQPITFNFKFANVS